MAQPVVLTGKGKGGAARLLREYPKPVVPYCVSTIFGNPLFEAEPRGLEGRCVRARHSKNSVAPGVVLTGKGKGAPARGLDLFFFFDKFWL